MLGSSEARHDPRRRSRSGRAWSRIAAGAILVAAAVVAGPVLSEHPAVTSMALRGEAPVAAQVRAAERMADLAGRIAEPWVDRRDTRSGLFVDPITGGAPCR